MRLRLNTFAFFTSAALCLAVLGIWAYSLISLVGMIHYKPHGDLEIVANNGRLEVRATTVNSDWPGNLFPDSELGWSAGASWSTDRPLASSRVAVQDWRLLGIIYQAGDVPTVINAAGGKDVGHTFWELRVPLLPIALLPMLIAAWTGYRWRAARPNRGPALDVGKSTTCSADQGFGSQPQQHRSAFRSAA